MVVVPKKDGRPRRTVDFQRLNRASLRETHHTRPPFDLVSSVPKHTFKTVADAYSGYHQVPLDEESRKLTTFITPWGRYRYRRSPMGHCASQDAFTKRFDDTITDVPRKLKCVDDTLLHDSSVSDAFWHTYNFLQRCMENGVTLRPDKFRFCRRSVTFAGYLLGWEGY
ncbi:Transposon Ty3-I Gag-Pol polyprotein [Chionoecetes opilio]|uniref:Transposon Ty3-I Gag-Pol polyprotein n=1 Tax=Chionoecetes opilio TaxID=41210 RepID=A0A8J4YPE8_CHIOP|nr:Transposon Ty3-I Gag-Pol polyprotein [Chionoecetes opilio]